MIKWAFLSLFGIFAAVGVYLYIYLGMFKPVEVSFGERGPYELIYKAHLGPYFKINESIIVVEEWAKKAGVDCSTTFGEFLDDPHAVEEDRLRSRAGCALTDSSNANVLLPEGLIRESRARDSYVIATFDGSPAVSPYTVYPRAFEFIEERRLRSRGPVIELYKLTGGAIQTEYLFPVTGTPASH